MAAGMEVSRWTSKSSFLAVQPTKGADEVCVLSWNTSGRKSARKGEELFTLKADTGTNPNGYNVTKNKFLVETKRRFVITIMRS